MGRNRWILLLAVFLLLYLTRSWPASWNDQSRLAAAWSVSEYHTQAIDQPENLLAQLTGDVCMAHHRLYSDKAPLLGFLAGLAAIPLHAAGLGLGQHLRLASYVLTLAFMGGPFFIYLFLLLRRVEDIPLGLVALLGTIALPYAFVFNNHLPAGLMLGIFLLRRLEAEASFKAALVDGVIVALAPAIDPASALVGLPLAVWGLIFRCRGHLARGAFILGGLIPLAAHLIINMPITGDWRPPNMHAELMIFPGSVWTQETLTGVGGLAWDSILEWESYLWHMTFGTKGFFTHNPLIFLGLIGLIVALIRPRPQGGAEGVWFDLPPLQDRVLAACIALGVAALMANYSLLSNNYGGAAYSVRWFVVLIPLLLPYALTALIKARGRWRLVGWGLAWLSVVVSLGAWPCQWLGEHSHALDMLAGLDLWLRGAFTH